MKNLILPMLCWAMSVAPLFAQKALPPGIQPYSVNWSYAVKQMLGAAGYEVPGPKAEFDLRNEITARQDEPQLDSTVTYFGYGLNGADSLPMFRYMYTYPNPGVEVVVESFYDQGTWTPLSMTSLVSDEAGRLVDAISFRYESAAGRFEPDSRIEFFPQANSKVNMDSFFISVWSVQTQSYNRQMAVWNEFDLHDHLEVSTSSIEIFEFPLVFKDKYVYNKDGALLSVESFNVEGEQLIPAGHQEREYDDNNLVRSIDYVSDGFGGYLADRKSEYTYTIFGKKETERHSEWNEEHTAWKVIRQDTYTYDHERRASMLESSFLSREDEEKKTRVTYSYAQDDYPAAETSYAWNSVTKEWELGEKKYYHYSNLISVEPGEHEVADASFISPNPTSGVVQVKLVGKVSVHIYTLSGQLVKRFYMSPGDKFLDLSQLPDGMYQVRATSDDDYFSGKLLVQ